MPRNRTKILLLSVLLLGMTALLILFTSTPQPPTQTSYWIWAGITANDAPKNAELYIYQGQIDTNRNKSTFRRHGLYPYPLHSSPVYLVYRLEGSLPDVSYITEIFKRNVADWERHHVTVRGLQIDFDSATSKLLIYNRFLDELRLKTDRKYKLSITGLSDWAVQGNQYVIKDITETTDEVVYQLYQDRHTLPDVDYYITALSRYPFPFRIGLLEKDNQTSYSKTLSQNPHYRGAIYFIQR